MDLAELWDCLVCVRYFQLRKHCQYRLIQISSWQRLCTNCCQIYVRMTITSLRWLLAMTEIEALCSFISLQELKSVLQNIPEIVELVFNEEANQVFHIKVQEGEENTKSLLQSIFTHLMTASNEMTTKAISKLKSRLHKESQDGGF